jgi:chromosome segregation ATPase
LSSNRTEEITSEVRKLVLTCRKLQSQLDQSIPKKEHVQIVSKMQEKIDQMNLQLKQTKADFEKNESLSEALRNLSKQLSTQNAQISSLFQMNTAISSKLGETTVPRLVYEETLSRVQELQASIKEMAQRNKEELAQLEEKKDALLKEKISAMVPREEYEAIQSELARNTVPKSKHEEEVQSIRADLALREEQLKRAESRISELETLLSDSRSELEGLAQSITSITRDASLEETPMATV